MFEPEIRKIASWVEEIRHEGGPAPDKPLRKAAIMAVIVNPFAGRYVEEIESASSGLVKLGVDLAGRLNGLIGPDPMLVEGYGKGAIVGEDGEIEHGALWHAPGGYGMREVLGGTMAIVPSAKKVGGPGTRIDIPVTHINASYVRSHFDSIEIGLADAPQRHEICLILAMTSGARIHNRAGGLRADQIKGEDGLR